MKVKTAYSIIKDAKAATLEIKQQIGTFNVKFLLFFASPSIDPKKISKEIQSAFPSVATFGCSSSGEIVNDKLLDNSLVAMAFSPEIISDCKIEVLTKLKTEKNQVNKAFDSFGSYFHESPSNLSPEKYVGLVLIDGLSLQEEKINERIGDLTNVTFIGGSAGDDLAFKETYVFANGETYTDAAVLALIKSNTRFEFLKTQSFTSTNKKAVFTKVDESIRKVIEINNKPATEAYAELVGVPESKVAESYFSHPVGLVFEDDFFVRSPQRSSGKEIFFFCSIKEGMELSLLESRDIVKSTQTELDNKIKTFGEISALINFNCILRTLELKKKNQMESYGKVFKNIPTIGFSTYGESYIGHMNQTSTILLFK
jgi:hypothetical protein